MTRKNKQISQEEKAHIVGFIEENFHKESFSWKDYNNFIWNISEEKPLIMRIINCEPTYYYSTKLKDDFDLAFLAVAKDWNILKNVDKQFKDNEKIVLAAIAQNPIALSFASDRLKNAEEIVLAAITSPKAIGHAASLSMSIGSDLKDNLEFMNKAIDVEPLYYSGLNNDLRNNIPLFIKAYENALEKDKGYIFMGASRIIRGICGSDEPVSALRAHILKNELSESSTKIKRMKI